MRQFLKELVEAWIEARRMQAEHYTKTRTGL
jgi:hypothetical protein